MKLESARELKADIARRLGHATSALSSAPAAGSALSFLSAIPVAAALAGGQRRPSPVSVGVSPGIGPGDYRLALRAAKPTAAANAAIEQIVELSKGEAEVRYVGKRIKLQNAGGTEWHRAKRRPLAAGVSIGHPDITAGTLGCFAIHIPTGKTVLLSNNHVLANENRAATGDPILQPGRADDGAAEADQVAALLEFVPLEPQGNIVDAAVASLLSGIQHDPTTLNGIGVLRGLRQSPVLPGDRVWKTGRTTGPTDGIVTAIELGDVEVGYDIGTCTFDGQIEIEGEGSQVFGAGGDSGSLIVDEDGLACGLLFAVSEFGGTNGKGLTNANDIRQVLSLLNLQLALGGPNA